MMDKLRTYFLSIVAVSIICSIVHHLMQNFHTKNLSRIICGLILTTVILHPLANYNDFRIVDMESIHCDAQEAVTRGKELSYNACADIIKLETEAYILDKASDLNADISVSVTVGGDSEPAPREVEIYGDISPFARMRLEMVLCNDLGITKENQHWNG